MLDVRTDHQIVAFGADGMTLFQVSDGQPIVSAGRAAAAGPWTVHAEGVPDATCATRPEAIDQMIEHALAALPGTGYSTLVPHGLRELP